MTNRTRINKHLRGSLLLVLLLTGTCLRAGNRLQAQADSSGRISIVAMYYDSLWRSNLLAGFNVWNENGFPRLQKDTADATQLMPVFPGSGEAQYTVESGASLITVERIATDEKSMSGTLQIKWLHDEKGEILLGLSLSERVAYRGWARAQTFFFVLHEGAWAPLPDPLPFDEAERFVPAGSSTKLLRQYLAVTALVRFNDASDGILVTPLVREDLNCDNQWDASWNAAKELGIKPADLKKICMAIRQTDRREFSCRWSDETRKYSEIR